MNAPSASPSLALPPLAREDPAVVLHQDDSQAVPSGFPLRLPVLRRPPGWTLLDEAALRARAVQLLHAQLQAAAPPDAEPASAASVPEAAPAWAPTPQRPTVAAAALPARVADAPPEAGIDPPARSVPSHRTLGSTPVALVALSALMGVMALAPWLIWAPLVGGLALGILLLQSGLLRRWLHAQRTQAALAEARAEAEAACQEPAGEASPGHAHTAPGPHANRGLAVVAVQAVKAPVRRMGHEGWLLAAVLVLVGVQAAMLIATVQVQRASAVKPPLGDPLARPGQGAGEPSAEDWVSGLLQWRPSVPPDPATAGTSHRSVPQEGTR